MATQKQSFGIKVAQTGYSADTAPDYALAFNSSWPSLPIVKEYTFTVTSSDHGGFFQYDDVTQTHNLGFYAWAQCWEIGRTTNVGGMRAVRNNADLYIGNNSVKWHDGTAYVGSQPSFTVHIKVYNIDISQPLVYDYVQPPVVQTPYDPNFGIKVTKEGKSIDSKDLRDFVIHSRAQSPAILSIITQASVDSSQNVTYTNPQGYTNWVYGYVISTSGLFAGFYQYATPQGQAYPVYRFVNGSTYSLSVNGGGGNIFGVSLVVLRDPLIVAKTVQVTY